MITFVSRAKHINPITGFEVPDYSITICYSCEIEEDCDNYYIVSMWEPTTEVFAKTKWERG